VYRITLWADIAALAWWVGRSLQAGIARWRARRVAEDAPVTGSIETDVEDPADAAGAP
jgi:hypothetical protein